MDPVDQRSHRLLNGLRRLYVAALVAELPTDFRTSEAVKRALDISPQDMSKEIKHFVECGLLEKTKHGHYRRRHDAFWEGCRTLYDESVRELRRPAPTKLRAVGAKRKP